MTKATGSVYSHRRRNCVVAATIVIPLLAGCAGRGETRAVHPGTARMAAILERVREGIPSTNEYANRAQAAQLGAVPEHETERERLFRLSSRAMQLLRAGQTERAIEEAERFVYEAEKWEGEERGILLTSAREIEALAFLRLGEEENCLEGHAPTSCILPIEQEAIHTRTRGSTRAAAIYRQLLDEVDPSDLARRWLLNLAHMTLGTYPEHVPEEYLISPAALRAEYDPGRFTNVAPALGIDVLGNAGGSIADDLDGDGHLDLMVSSWSLSDPVRFFRNNGDGTFTDATVEAGLGGIVGGLNMVHADYDNDGFPDVFVLRGAWYHRDGRQPNSLLRNNGDGTFSDVTFEAGVYSEHPTQTAAWADFDGDGWLDLFIGNETTGSLIHPSELYRNNGDGTFTDVARAVGVDVRVYAKGAAWGDVDNDGRPDLYVSTFDGPNLLFRNAGPLPDGGWRFDEIGKEAGVDAPERSFPTWFFDYDNDGWEDVFVSGYAADLADVAAEYLGLPHDGGLPRLYRNNGDGTFSDVSARVGLERILLTMGCNFGDFDNDGYLDFYVGTGDPDMRKLIPNRLFRNDGGVRFQDVTTAAGVGHLQKGHGVSFADFDRDGALDIHSVMGGAYEGDVYQNVLFHNPGPERGYLALQLQGVHSNRAAIGARVEVRLFDKGFRRSVHRTVSTGGSFGGNPLELHIGLGEADRIEGVVVAWPSGLRQTYSSLEPNAAFRLVEGEKSPVRLFREHVPFALKNAHPHAH